MKLILIPDVHLEVDSAKVLYEGKAVSKKAVQALDGIQYAYNWSTKNLDKDDRNFVFMGDHFTARTSVDIGLTNLYKELHDRNRDIVNHRYWYDGNHDLNAEEEYASSAIPLFLDSTSKVDTYIPHHTFHVMDNMIFLAYSGEKTFELLNEIFEDYISDDPDKDWILFLHHGINEALTNNGTKIKTGLSMKTLKKGFKKVFSGHYHNPQEIKDGGFELVYVGSMYQKNWGEAGEEKRFILLDTETLEWKSIPLEGFYSKHIYLDEFSEESIRKYNELIEEGHYVCFNLEDLSEYKRCKKIGYKCKYIGEIIEKKTNTSIDIKTADPNEEWMKMSGIEKDKMKNMKIIGDELKKKSFKKNDFLKKMEIEEKLMEEEKLEEESRENPDNDKEAEQLK